MERDGRRLDLDRAAADMAAYAEAGFDTFDMADHYGSAEDIAGRFNRMRRGGAATLAQGHGRRSSPNGARRRADDAATSCAPPSSARCDRLQRRPIDLLQLHWWTFQHPAWLDAMHELAKLQGEGLIGHLGVTNFDTDHLRVLVKDGIRIATNQVCFSLLDRRAAEEMTRLLPRRRASGCSPMARSPAASSPRNGWASPSRRRAISPTGAR